MHGSPDPTADIWYETKDIPVRECPDCGEILSGEDADADACPYCAEDDEEEPIRQGEALAQFRHSYPYCRDPAHCTGSCRRDIACNH